MILWILALVLIAVVGLVGYYQGAVRAAFSFLGLLIAALAAGALGGLLTPLLGLTGLKHPILQQFLGPVIAFVLILVIFKIAARTIHNKLELYYKHHDSDTRRLLFERLNTRVGAAVGVANGIVYFFFIIVAIHVLGYFTTQVRGSDNDPFATRLTSRLAAD